VGDEALAAAIQSYRAQDDHDASYMQKLIESQSKKNLEWFFDDWVYRDRGLPDFHIVTAYPRQILGGQWLVTITVENLGSAAAEVPVMAEVPGGERNVRLLVKAGEKAIARINTQQVPSEIVVNDGSVPESDLTNNRFKVVPPAK
jgi:aminopeptidase N